MDNRRIVILLLMLTLSKRIIYCAEDSFIASESTEKLNFETIRHDGEPISSFTNFDEQNRAFRMPDRVNRTLRRRLDRDRFYENTHPKYTILDGYWYTNPNDNYGKKNESLRKIEHAMTLPAWSTSKKEYFNNRNRKNNRRQPLDPLEDYFGLDSKLHELMSDRKYAHEHESIFFPIPVPSSHHHEKDDHHLLIPLLLLLLIPLLLFAIIIPLNANLLSTLFLIMQNNGGTVSAAQIANGRRKKRYLYTEYHPVIEEKVEDLLLLIDKIMGEYEDAI
ncbi:hypothetical protein JTE90_004430 [Oedothorax gibbosus]|uniref:Uncharacterized protein n=1 Tax=Oedothorax gibbosus TaxID=931172 RepID=A0AAV6UQV4_9ARAC|nr:hypothetical protein JTE90_004430 [Oedothorax gibbosus]